MQTLTKSLLKSVRERPMFLVFSFLVSLINLWFHMQRFVVHEKYAPIKQPLDLLENFKQFNFIIQQIFWKGNKWVNFFLGLTQMMGEQKLDGVGPVDNRPSTD